MTNEWILRKKEVASGKVLPLTAQHQFILNAVKLKDPKAIELGIKFNLDFNITNVAGRLMWFDLADQIKESNDQFATRTLMLLSKIPSDIIYASSSNANLLAASLCKEREYYFSTEEYCDYSHPLAKFFYNRYLDDLLKFQFKGDLQILAKLVINIDCNIDALELAHQHGLVLNEELVGEFQTKCGVNPKLNEIVQKANNALPIRLATLKKEVEEFSHEASNYLTDCFIPLQSREDTLKELYTHITNGIDENNIPDITGFKFDID